MYQTKSSLGNSGPSGLLVGITSFSADTGSTHKITEEGGPYITDDRYKFHISSDRLAYLKKLVDDAIREHKIFTIKGGWSTLRRALLRRNWVEKFDHGKPYNKSISASNSNDDLCSNLPARQTWETPSAHLAKCERTVMSRLLQIHDVDFYWNSRKDAHDLQLRMNCHKLISRFSRSLFTSKEGLCLLLQQMYWHIEPGLANVNFPRCYVLGFPDHFNNFVDDFRLTACASLLKYVVNIFTLQDGYALQSPEGEIPFSSMQFAMDRLNEFLAFKKHLDIDLDIPCINAAEWDAFLKHFSQIVHENKLFLEQRNYSLDMLIAASRGILKKMTQYWPQFELDGMKNIWIMKPGNKCRGRGIQLIKDVADVAKIMELKLKYVVQKYIEKPLIIYNTKFDIRQWFMITSVQPLMIWMYRESYLRFSSQNFNLENFHESLHLTNHAVQCKYKNTDDRNKALPEENMWDSHMFKEYLKRGGHEHKWDTVIYPGMKESIIGSMLACQETMDRRPNTFELYGADFILAEDYKPWLLEINSSPDLSSSTSVTARMCPQCLEDVVKVVIDRRRDPSCSTGLFDMIYKQNLPRAPAYLGMSLSVRGRRIFKRHKVKNNKENDVIKKSSKGMRLVAPEKLIRKDSTPVIPKYSGPVINDLMEEISKSIHQDSDNDAGVEMADPIRLIRRKTNPKHEARQAAKVLTHRLTRTSTKPHSSPSKKSSENGNLKMPRTASSPKKSKIKFAPDNAGDSGWALGRAKLHFQQDVWKTDSVSILRGKHGKFCFNKELSNKSHCFESHDAKTFKPFGLSGDKKNLLTVGQGLGLGRFTRPNT